MKIRSAYDVPGLEATKALIEIFKREYDTETIQKMVKKNKKIEILD